MSTPIQRRGTDAVAIQGEPLRPSKDASGGQEVFAEDRSFLRPAFGGGNGVSDAKAMGEQNKNQAARPRHLV